MNEKEREEFLQEFTDVEETKLAFAVTGGMFSEGIDLIGNKLIGAINVGVGLPQICLERNIIKDYFQDKNGLGFEYAYMYPGMNKVLQAAGRVIRTEKDRGMVLLIDDRFLTPEYMELFPHEWKHFKRVSSKEKLKFVLNEFWNSEKI
jgi:Rad3-related DNA helicase